MSFFSLVFCFVISCSLLKLCRLTWCVSWLSQLLFHISGPISITFHLKFDNICVNSRFHLECHTDTQNQLYLLCQEFAASIFDFDSMFAGFFVGLSTCFCGGSFDFSSGFCYIYRTFWMNLSCLRLCSITCCYCVEVGPNHLRGRNCLLIAED